MKKDQITLFVVLRMKQTFSHINDDIQREDQIPFICNVKKEVGI